MSKRVNNRAGKVISVSTATQEDINKSSIALNKAISQGFYMRGSDMIVYAVTLKDCIRLHIAPSCYFIVKADEKPIEITLETMSA